MNKTFLDFIISRGVRTLIIKEFLAVWRDKKTRISLIAPPIVQLFIFTFAATLEVKNISLVIFNQDYGHHSRELIQRITASPRFTKIKFVFNQQDLDRAITHNDAFASIRISQDFSRLIEQGQSGPLQLFLDGRSSNASLIIAGYLTQVLDTFSQDIARDMKRPIRTINIETRNWFNANLNYAWFTVPSLFAILGMLIALIVTSLSVAREREMGTFEQLLIAPVTPNQILVGKAIPAMIIALGECLLILFISEYLLGIVFQGSYILLTLSMFFFLLAVVGLGLFISSLCMTQQQAVLGTFLLLNPAVILSGFAAPIENMPTFLQHVTMINPLSHFMIVIKGVYLKDISFQAVLNHTWQNALIATLTLSLASWFFRQRME